MERIIFRSPEAFLATVISGQDLYSKSLCLYVFVYNESGSVCVYGVDNETALDLEKKAKEHCEYWSAYLGLGGEIYDTEDYFKESKGSVPKDVTHLIDLCRQWWQDEWYTCGPVLSETGKEHSGLR